MNKNLALAILCIALIAIITLLSALPFGFSKTEETAISVPAELITPVRDETKGYSGTTPGPVVHRITFTNTWLPRQVPLPRANACLYNSKTRQGAWANAHWQISTLESKISDFNSGDSVVQLGRETRTVELTIDQFVRWQRQPSSPAVPQKPVPAPIPGESTPVTDYPEGFDTLYLFLIDRNTPDFYPDCGNLQSADLMYAKKIAVV